MSQRANLVCLARRLNRAESCDSRDGVVGWFVYVVCVTPVIRSIQMESGAAIILKQYKDSVRETLQMAGAEAV